MRGEYFAGFFVHLINQLCTFYSVLKLYLSSNYSAFGFGITLTLKITRLAGLLMALKSGNQLEQKYRLPDFKICISLMWKFIILQAKLRLDFEMI